MSDSMCLLYLYIVILKLDIDTYKFIQSYKDPPFDNCLYNILGKRFIMHCKRSDIKRRTKPI